jgi:short-subunit dehydrogenase
VPKSIAVFGAGPALGRAVGRRYAREGYKVVLVARRREPLDALADELHGLGAPAHVIAADLSDTDGIPRLAEEIRTVAGDPGVIYYGAAPGVFMPAAELTPRRARELMPLGVYAPLALVQAFLPAMLTRGDGAILTAQGASAVYGMPNIGGGLAIAAQRNYLQGLHAEVAGNGVYVGGLYIGAVIEHSAFHAQRERARAAGASIPEMPAVDPASLADLLWTMHNAKGPAEATYPEHLFDR